jgi:hypothetical protein
MTSNKTKPKKKKKKKENQKKKKEHTSTDENPVQLVTGVTNSCTILTDSNLQIQIK